MLTFNVFNSFKEKIENLEKKIGEIQEMISHDDTLNTEIDMSENIKSEIFDPNQTTENNNLLVKTKSLTKSPIRETSNSPKAGNQGEIF